MQQIPHYFVLQKRKKEFCGFTASSDHLGEKNILFQILCQISSHLFHCTACYMQTSDFDFKAALRFSCKLPWNLLAPN